MCARVCGSENVEEERGITDIRDADDGAYAPIRNDSSTDILRIFLYYIYEEIPAGDYRRRYPYHVLKKSASLLGVANLKSSSRAPRKFLPEINPSCSPVALLST